MSFRPRPDPAARGRAAARPCSPRRRPWIRVAFCIAACALLIVSPALSKERVLVGGLLDSEIWKTDGASRFLSRNDGDAAPATRLRLWAVGEFLPRLQGCVLGEVEGGNGSAEGKTTHELEQAYLRYSFRPPLRLTVEAGQIVTPIGNFSRRYLSSVNPLIGSPDHSSLSYPPRVPGNGQA